MVLRETPGDGVSAPLRRRGPRHTAGGAAASFSQIEPQHGNCFHKENGFCGEPSTTPESGHSDPPRILHAPAGSPSCYGSSGSDAQCSSLPSQLPPPALPAACPGVQNQGRHPEALQGLLPGEEAGALVHLLQNEPKAQAEADVKGQAKVCHGLGKGCRLIKGK